MAPGRRKSRRRLTDEDRALWDRVSATLTPLERRQRDTGGETPPIPTGPKDRRGAAASPAPAPQPPFRRGVPPEPQPRLKPSPSRDVPVRINLAPDPMEALRQARPRMDAKTLGRMKRGKLAPEARIDLHGMTVDRAHGALRRFISDVHARDLRLVLVITGKGRRDHPEDSPSRQGVLRTQVPQWLGQPPLSAMVLQITPAHDRHGGGGAYYVYLRRRR